MKNAILGKIHQGEKALGTFTHLQSTIAIECLGYTGLDFVVIDMEHSPVGTEGAAHYIAAAQAAGLTPFVRVNEIGRSPILKMLDAGAQGIIVPCVETVEQVKQLIQYAKYAPMGARGFCPTRDGGWGFADCAKAGITDYMQTCNRETLLLPQCETLGCLEHIEEIVGLDGVDGILIGPFDLSIAMNKPAQFTDPQVKQAIDRIVAACKAAGKIAIIFAGDAKSAKTYFAEGFDCVAVGLDTIVYTNAYRRLVTSVFENYEKSQIL